MINVQERELYIHLMEKALNKRYNENTTLYNLSSEEVSLYLFFTSKVLKNIFAIKMELDKRRQYKLIVKTKNNSDIYSVVKYLRKKNLSVFYNKKNKLENGAYLDIVGDIKKSKLEKMINEVLKYRKNFKYNFVD